MRNGRARRRAPAFGNDLIGSVGGSNPRIRGDGRPRTERATPAPLAPAGGTGYTEPMTDPEFHARYGPWALVTGCSSGIGAELVRELSRRGVSVVMVARRRERLEALAREIGARVELRIVAADLTAPGAVAGVLEEVAGLDIGLLANNAGFGLKGPFLELPLEDQLRMVDLNCRVPVQLTHALAPAMVDRGRGGVIMMSSLAAFQGTPYTALYAATKGLLHQLGEGLWYELAPRGVDVVSVCPGATDTEGPPSTGVDPDRIPFGMMDPARVAQLSLDALGRRSFAIPGLVNNLSHLLVKVAPRALSTRQAGRIMERITRAAPSES